MRTAVQLCRTRCGGACLLWRVLTRCSGSLNFKHVHLLQVLAEADLPPLLPDITATSALGGAPAAGASAASGAWDAAFSAAAGLPPLRTGQPGSPLRYAPFGATPPPFRGASATFGAAGFAAGGLAAKLQGGTPQQLLQGGPGRLACISAPAACMQSAAAWDAVHYAARHAHMLQDLRGRPVRGFPDKACCLLCSMQCL
jgi:hypothetical protein